MPDLPFRRWPSEVECKKSSDLVAMYERGYQGAVKDPAFEEQFVASLPFSSFEAVCDSHNLWGADEGEDGLYLPFLHVVRAEAEAKGLSGTLAQLSNDASVDPWPERQATGDCVSHWARNHFDITRAAEIYHDGEAEGWHVRTATEPIYGARGHSGQGANCSRLASFLIDAGGYLRKVHEIPGFGKLDLSTYNANIGIKWGSSGVPQSVQTYAKQNSLKSAAPIRSIEGAVAAFKSGRTCGGCSGLGFSGTRNEDGVSEQTTSWAHAMVWSGLDARPSTVSKYGGRLWLVQNSWGRWNNGPRKIRGTDISIPHGAFWMREKSAAKMISGGGVYTFAGVSGWAALRLPDLGATGKI